MRFLAALLALGYSASALAGGFGLVGTGGFHTEKVFFYDSSNEDAQYQLSQTLGNFGGGAEVLLGDKDDRFTGVMRMYYVIDGGLTHPAELTQLVDQDDVVADVREEPRHLGIATVGLHWAILGQPEQAAFVILADVGSGFLTGDHTEFLVAEAGAGVSYQVARDVRAFANVTYTLRYRKGASHGANAYAGIRYFFD